MLTRDYIKTIGHEIEQPPVPLPYALGLIAAIMAVGAYGFQSTWPAPQRSGAPHIVVATGNLAVVVAGK